jgi:feruloyl-CoA synthase
LEELIHNSKILKHLKKSLQAYNKTQGGSSTTIRRIMLMIAPPSIDANEITDKGYINQRATLEMRKGLVDQLHVENPGPEVIVV